jgi:hypothetical protein
MTNVSLARIMYGTNQDLHVPEPAVMSRAVTTDAAPAVKSSSPSELPTLDELLHNAWSRMTHKS